MKKSDILKFWFKNVIFITHVILTSKFCWYYVLSVGAIVLYYQSISLQKSDQICHDYSFSLIPVHLQLVCVTSLPTLVLKFLQIWERAIDIMHKLFCKIWQAGERSGLWIKSIFILISKKGDMQECTNYSSYVACQ